MTNAPSLSQRRDAAGRDVGAVEFGHEAAIAGDADAAAEVWLKIDVRRWRDERHHLAAFVDERELRCTGALRDDRPQDADGVVTTSFGRQGA